MGGLGIWLRAEARRRWRAWLAIAVITGVGWGGVLVAVAGARRTQSAFTRFRSESQARDILFSGDGPVLKGLSAEVERLPEVAAAGPLAALDVEVLDPPPPASFLLGAAFLPVDNRLGHTIDRSKIIAGRLPDPSSLSEGFANPAFARGLRIGVGDTVTLRPFGEDNDPNTPVVYGEAFRIRIVGIGVSQAEVYPITFWDRISPGLTLTPAAYRAYGDSPFIGFDGVVLRTKPGTDMAAFQRTLTNIKRRHPEAGDPSVPPFLASEVGRAGIVQAALRPQMAALAAFAAALAITLLLVMTQTVTRQILTRASEYPALRALGFTHRQLTIAALVPVVGAALVAATIAVGVAVAGSPMTPIGAARLAEPNPGVALDGLVLPLGAVTIVVLLIFAAAIPASRAAKLAGLVGVESERTSWLADRLARSGLPAPASTGLRMALEPGRGPTAVPVRTVIAGAIVSVTALAAAYTFGASLDRAVATPRIFGQRWDAIIDGQFGVVRPEWFRLTTDPSYAAVAGGVYPPGPLTIAGNTVPVFGIEQLKGTVFPTLLEGRPPTAADEIVLGTSTLRRLKAKVGDRVGVDGNPTPMRVVGRGVFPAFGLGALFPTDLGDGGAVAPAALGEGLTEPGAYSFVLVRFAPGASNEAIKRVEQACKTPELAVNLCAVLRLQQPPEIASYGRVRNLPWILATVLGILAAATLSHALLATVRRRRRDLAMLKTLGFLRRQLSAAVAWQATTLIAFAAVGIPLGIVAGRWAWIALADQLGIPAEPRVPMLVIALTIPALVVLGNVVAALPGRAASRTQAALVLRTE